MKKIAKTMLAVGIILTSIWIPFYIGSHFNPFPLIENWWSIPLFLTLIAIFLTGFYNGIRVFEKLEEEDSQ